MDAVTPWAMLEGLVEPHYPRGEQGRPPMPLRTMLRIYFMQQWFQLSDPAMEDALYDSQSMQRFAGLELGRDAIPDETTILNFRHLLERHELTGAMFGAVRDYLEEKGILVRQGTIMDATIIHAPSSTKNRDKGRDADMSSTRKGNQWYFGMKAHIGVDNKSGLVHSVVCTTASVHDSKMADDLLHGDEREIYGDKAYCDEKRRQAFRAKGVRWRVSLKAKRGAELSERDKKWNKSRNRVRAKVEHSFGIVKNVWGYRKVRYDGLSKNADQMFTLFTLSNIYLARKSLQRILSWQQGLVT
jgi:IS5 family transposase